MDEAFSFLRSSDGDKKQDAATGFEEVPGAGVNCQVHHAAAQVERLGKFYKFAIVILKILRELHVPMTRLRFIDSTPFRL